MVTFDGKMDGIKGVTLVQKVVGTKSMAHTGFFFGERKGAGHEV